MLDCARVQRVQGGLEVVGRRESLLHPLGNKIPTHCAVAWQDSDRKGFSEMAGQGMARALLPPPAKFQRLEVYRLRTEPS